MSTKIWKEQTIPKILKAMGHTLPPLISVLDIGCGVSFKAQYIPAEIHIAFDIYRPYFGGIDTNINYTPVVGNAKDVKDIFMPKSFDMVIATDIIEHMHKADGLQLLKDIEWLAKKVVYIEVPETYIPQNLDIWNKGGHTWQTHRSSGEWSIEELQSFGYDISTRDYVMTNAKRHTEIDDIDPNVVILDGVKFL